jgi:2',3'-cyclic-nucleotide 2'-phosphodiesterase (5'-nucleotidase family)
MMTAINEIRARRTRGRTLLINTGDTIQGQKPQVALLACWALAIEYPRQQGDE